MVKEILTFRNVKIEKKIYRHESLISNKDVNIEKVLVSNKISVGEKKL